MKHTYFSVGPTELYPTVKTHLAEAMDSGVLSLSHRGPKFAEIYTSAMKGVRELMSVPESYSAFFLTSGSEGMERLIQNCVEKKSGHVVYGAFARKWKKISEQLGKSTEHFTVDDGLIPDLTNAAFSNDVELIAFTHNETSTGGMLEFNAIADVKRRHPNALIAVDVVSSAPTAQIDWDTVDCALLSVQKGFGLPAGLGMIFVSPRAIERAGEVAKKVSVGSYHSFPELIKYAEKGSTNETPNVLNVYLLDKVSKDLLAVGLQSLREKEERIANEVYAFLEGSPWKPGITDVLGRSKTTIVALTPSGSKPILEALKAEGLIVGSGYGDNKEKQIRIGNFPAHTEEDFKRLIAGLTTISRRLT